MTSVFPHLGFKMGGASELIAHPRVSASGKGKTLPFYCSPQLAYKELFGSLAQNEKMKSASALDKHLLDFMVDDVKRVRKTLSASEKESSTTTSTASNLFATAKSNSPSSMTPSGFTSPPSRISTLPH